MKFIPIPAPPGALRAWLAAASLLFGNACFETQTAGTSTTTGNTISARVMLSDGRPAAGAEVAVHPSGFLPAGIPGSRAGEFSATVFADSTGFFRVSVPPGNRYFLAVYSAGPGGRAETYWRDGVAPGTPSSKSAGADDTVRLQWAASLSGHLVGAVDSVWVGFPGTSHFVRPDADGSFSLDLLPPGNPALRIIRSGAGTKQTLEVIGWTALPGQAMHLDTLRVPADGTVLALSAPACLDAVDSLVHAPSHPGPSDSSRVVRTTLLSSPPEWVELDVCLGLWTRKGSLPATLVGSFDLWAGPGKDYLIHPDSSRILEIDAAGARMLPTFPDSLAQASFHGGRYYAFFHLDTVIQSFPNEAAWLAKTPDRNFPRPVVAFQRFIVDGGGIQFLIPDGSDLALQRYDFGSGSFLASVTLHEFTGSCVGMASGTAGEVWLLNEARELHRMNGSTGSLLSKTRIAAPHGLRGLARSAE